MPKDKKNILKSVNPNPATPLNEKIKFSFEFYDTNDNNEFCMSRWDKNQVAKALERLKEINDKTFNDLNSQRRIFHFHPVDWNKTTKKQGFPYKRANDLEPYQFSLLNVSGQEARVFGAYSKDTFYIVWFDIEHKIWPSFLKHT